MSIISMTLTLGFVSKNLIPSEDMRDGAFLKTLGSYVTDLQIPGCSEFLKLYYPILF